MSTTIDNIMSLLKKTFEDLGIPLASHDVYIQLLEKGKCSATQLANLLSIPRTSVYDHLKLLIQKGLVTEHYDLGKKIFRVDNPQNLPKLIDKEIALLTSEKGRIQLLLPSLIKSAASLEPKIRFYAGVEGVRHVLNDFKWQRNTNTMAMWSMTEMISLLGKDFFVDMNRNRIKHDVYMRGIWPESGSLNLKEHPYMGTGPEFLREVRVAPKSMRWNIGCWIYGDKVAFISSQQEVFGFTIHSKDFSNLMKVLLESIWHSSRPIKPQRKYTDAWIEEVYKGLGKKPPYSK